MVKFLRIHLWMDVCKCVHECLHYMCRCRSWWLGVGVQLRQAHSREGSQYTTHVLLKFCLLFFLSRRGVAHPLPTRFWTLSGSCIRVLDCITDLHVLFLELGPRRIRPRKPRKNYNTALLNCFCSKLIKVVHVRISFTRPYDSDRCILKFCFLLQANHFVV